MDLGSFAVHSPTDTSEEDQLVNLVDPRVESFQLPDMRQQRLV